MGQAAVVDEPQGLVLEYLRRLDRKVDALTEEFRNFNLRVGAGESHITGLHVADVQQAGEIDRIKERLTRVERRLDLVDR
jgi:hypothetical protein